MPHISPKEAHIAGQRAAHFRRRQAITDGGPSEHAVMERITFIAGIVRPTKDPDWWIIGLVMDGVAERELIVYFNPATRAVKVQRPIEQEPRPAPAQPSTFPHVLSNKGVSASPAYRYFFEDREYSPDEAGKLVKDRGTVGWRWEPK